MRSAACLAVLVALAACGHPEVRIRNESGTELRNVRISGRGFTKSVPSIPANELREVEIAPRGESGVAVAFDSDGRHVEVPEQGYIEDDPLYVVDVKVSPALAVEVRVERRWMPQAGGGRPANRTTGMMPGDEPRAEGAWAPGVGQHARRERAGMPVVRGRQ